MNLTSRFSSYAADVAPYPYRLSPLFYYVNAFISKFHLDSSSHFDRRQLQADRSHDKRNFTVGISRGLLETVMRSVVTKQKIETDTIAPSSISRAHKGKNMTIVAFLDKRMTVTYRKSVSDFDFRYRADPNLGNSKGHVTIQEGERQPNGNTLAKPVSTRGIVLTFSLSVHAKTLQSPESRDVLTGARS